MVYALSLCTVQVRVSFVEKKRIVFTFSLLSKHQLILKYYVATED